MNEIKAGDTVRLKSGGPLMTVSRLFDSTEGMIKAHCDWFEGNKHMSGSFPINSLKLEQD